MQMSMQMFLHVFIQTASNIHPFLYERNMNMLIESSNIAECEEPSFLQFQYSIDLG